MADPSKPGELAAFKAYLGSMREETRFLRRNGHRMAGGHFAAMGAFSTLIVLGYFDHPPLDWYSPAMNILWHPALAVGAFCACYCAFFRCRSWYVRNPPAYELRRKVGEGERRLWRWLGAALALIVLAGSCAGLAACGAGLAISAWVLAYRFAVGPVWRTHAFWAVLLVPASVLPPVLGLSMPNLPATTCLIFLGCLQLLGGLADAALYYGFVKRVREDAAGP